MSSAPPYFVDHKRGEVNELKALLSNPKLDREPEKKREVIKKVIAYMTLGIDVSRVFSEMIMAASTKDMVQKKMVYHYLCAYAVQKADLALLAINTLQKDCRDDDPMIRGLALRSLSSLRLPNLTEYIISPLRAGLNDMSPYVKKTAVNGVAKLYQINAHAVKDSDFIDILYNLLRDRDSAVVTNCIQALNEILSSEGGMAVTPPIIFHLLNRIKEFNEWGQCTLLDLLARYQPQNENEMFDIMNLLEDRLKHANSAVVMAATNVFLVFTKDNDPLHQEVYKRLKAPLITLMSSNAVELSYAILSHIKILVERAPGVFNDEYKHFFIRYTDPSCVKSLKLSILSSLVNQKNFGEILKEMSEYVTDVDKEIARSVITTIGKIAIKYELHADMLDVAIEYLLGFLDLQTDYVSCETVTVIKDILRKYPERYEDLVRPTISKITKTVEEMNNEPDAQIAVLWIVGEYGENIEDAPYILESLFIDKFKDENSEDVRKEMLTATMKLFFKRPPEVQGMLGRLLSLAAGDDSKVEVRDRALFYYRLLSYDVLEAARVVNCPKVIVDVFAESSEGKEMKEKIFKEFNSLSTVYNLPSDRFVKNAEELEEERKKAAAEAVQQEESASTSLISESEERPKSPTLEAQTPTAAPVHAAGGIIAAPSNYVAPATGAQAASGGAVSSVDLLGDLLSLGGGGPSSQSAPLTLIAGATVDKSSYQSKWAKLPGAASVELLIKNAAVNAKVVESLLTKQNIVTFASGTVGTVMKFYLFARDSSTLFLIECIIDLSSGKLMATIKADNDSARLAPLLAATIRNTLAPLL